MPLVITYLRVVSIRIWGLSRITVVGALGVGSVGRNSVGNTMNPLLGKNYQERRMITVTVVVKLPIFQRIPIVAEGTIRTVQSDFKIFPFNIDGNSSSGPSISY
jgi:hypothetical protein